MNGQRLQILIIVFSVIVVSTTCWKLPDNIRDTYFGTISKEHSYTSTKVHGNIPDWIEGYFLHQSCGTYGNQSNPEIGAKAVHSFDGLGAVASFKFKEGAVDFGMRFYETQSFKIWDYYDWDMDKSKIAWSTSFSPVNQKQFRKWENFQDYTGDNPFVTFWKIGDNVEAMSEGPAGVWFDLESLETKGEYPFKDNNFGFPDYMTPINNPAHEHYGEDGVTVYGVTAMMNVSDVTNINIMRMIYKIQDEERIPMVLFQEAGPLDSRLCNDEGTYPKLKDRSGYLHSFAMTQNYFVLPISTFFIDLCKIFKSKPSDPVLPGFASYYNYTKDIPTRFVIVSKQSNQVVGEFTTSDGIFVTHQLNSYEKDGLMYLDMLTYHANIYALLTIKNIVEKPTTPIDTHVERFVIDMSDWSLVKRIDLYPSAEFKTVEFSTINYEHYSSKPYKYAYMTGLNPAVTTLIKLNVETNKAVYWGPHDGLLPSEPIFIPSPNAVDEDDGVIVTNVLDTNTSKGIVVVLDAKSFTELGRAVSSELMPFGLHSRFIARKFERRSRHSLLRFLSDSSVHKVTRV